MNNEFDDLTEIDQMIKDAKATVPKSKKSKKVCKRIINVTVPQDKFLNFVVEDKREEMYELCFSGGVGSGKSFALCLMLLKYVQVPNTVVLLVHNHFSMLKKTTLPLLINGTVSKTGEVREPLLGPQFIQSFNKSEAIIILTNGSKIILSGCQDGEKLKSMNITAAFIDELTHLSKDSYMSILQRCRIFNKNPPGVYACTNPSGKNSWVYKHFEDARIPGYREMITVSSWSNRENLPDSYLKSLDRLPELDRKKMLLGEWLNSGSTVFYTFDTSCHVQNLNDWKKDDYDDYILCNDLGGGAKYSGTALIGRKDGRYYILDEFSKKKTTHKEVLDWLEKYRHLTELVAYDPANAVFCTDLENNSWIPTKPNKDIEHGVSKLNSLFAENRIIVNSKCQVAIKQFQDAYRNPETDKWDKNNAEIDMIDAIRYGILCFDDNSLMDKKQGNGKVFVFAL